jgi:hypothetical protein
MQANGVSTSVSVEMDGGPEAVRAARMVRVSVGVSGRPHYSKAEHNSWRGSQGFLAIYLRRGEKSSTIAIGRKKTRR